MFFRIGFNWQFAFDGLLGLFTFCGFCPIKIDRKEKTANNFDLMNSILLIWSMVHIFIAGVCVFFAAREFMSEHSEVESFNNILKFAITSITHFAACLESIAVRRNFVDIWIRVKLIDDMIAGMLPNYDAALKSFYKSTSRKIILSLLFTIISELIIIFNILPVKSYTFMWCVLVIPLMMSRLRHFQHTLFIDTLTHRFRIIKQELKSIVKLTKLDSNTLMVKNYVFYDGLFKKISTIKSVYNVLWETSLLINRSFGVSQLANLLQNFIQLTCDLYLLYSFLYNNNMTYIWGNLSIY